MKNKQKTKNSSSSWKGILALSVIIFMCGGYWYQTKDTKSETYSIQKADDWKLKEATYINLTGKAAESKSIKLSEGYWESGKFDF